MLQILGSVTKKMLEASQDLEVYLHDVPDDFEVPCMFIETVSIEDEQLTPAIYVHDVTIYYKLFHHDEMELKQNCFNIVSHLKAEQRCVPVLNLNGEKTDRYFYLDNISTNETMTEVEDIYIQQITINLQVRRPINEAIYDNVEHIFSNIIGS